MRRGLEELAQVLREMRNPGLLPDEEEPVTLSGLIAAVERAESRASDRAWEDDMGEDL